MSSVGSPLTANGICWKRGSVSHLTGALCAYGLISLRTGVLSALAKATWLLCSKPVRALSLGHMDRINPASAFTSHTPPALTQ